MPAGLPRARPAVRRSWGCRCALSRISAGSSCITRFCGPAAIAGAQARFPALAACSFDQGFHSPTNQGRLGASRRNGSNRPAGSIRRRARLRALPLSPAWRQARIRRRARLRACAPRPSRQASRQPDIRSAQGRRCTLRPPAPDFSHCALVWPLLTADFSRKRLPEPGNKSFRGQCLAVK